MILEKMETVIKFKITKFILANLLVLALGITSAASSNADPLLLSPGDSVAVASDPQNVLTNPMVSAVLTEVDSANVQDLFECGNIVDIEQTVFNLTDQANSETIGDVLDAEASGIQGTNFVFDSTQSYTIWCVTPVVDPYYFDQVEEIQLLFRGSLTAWVLIVGPNSFVVAADSSGISSGPSAAELAAIQAAIQAAIAQAKAVLTELFNSGKPGTFQQYRSAEYIVNNEKVVEKVNAAVLKLDVADRSDASKIAAIVNLENFIDLVSTPETQKYVTGQKLVELGLVEKTSKNKASITRMLKKADAASVNTIEKIQEAIAAELKVFAARADRTAAIKAKIAARNK